MRLSIFFLMTWATLWAGVIKQPEYAISQLYPKASVDKKRALLTGAEASRIEHMAKQRLASKIITYYEIKKGHKTRYAVLLTTKVRSKTMTALVFIEEGKLSRIEMVAFYEPAEYLPSHRWMTGLEGKSSSYTLQPRRDIPTITGATLSANAVARTARLALAFVAVKLDR